ncbi:sensor domain-containing diguanylate cyclase [Parafrankia sp. Ea1.12]|uniref:sensor domain-containing protein n=1 Tax=Parafrankia sp. Ea1.12 TaxID=573499 RepID=UPI0011BF1FA3|nr:sensor domain-containing diguanylate cyclase [Parafrankia sp. Ea1.12]
MGAVVRQGGEGSGLFDLMEIGLGIIGVADYRVRRVNQATCRILGRNEDELVGVRWETLVHPDDWEAHLAEARQNQTAGQNHWQGVVRFVQPSGSVVHVLATSMILTDDVAPAEAERPYFLVQFQDLSQQLASHRHLRLVMENTPVTLALVDRDGCVLFNEGAIGEDAVRRLEIARRRSIFEVFRDLPDALDLTRRALAGQRACGVFSAYGHWYESQTVPICDAQGVVQSVAIVSHDVTEREIALAELRVRSAEQALVAEIGRCALGSPDPASLWHQATTAISGHLCADQVTIRAADPHSGLPHVVATAGSAAPYYPSPPPSAAPDGTALAGSRTDPPRGIAADSTSSSLTIPIGQPDNPGALLTIDRRNPDSFARHEVMFLEMVATVLAAADERFRIERDAQYQARHDGLTGLPNRTAFLDRLQRTLTRAGHDRRRTGLLFIDLDNFKRVNDSYGHQTGDDLLREVAARLQRAVRPEDSVARLSGDEFAVLCDRDPALPDVQAIARRIVTTLAAPRIVLAGQPITVAASIGIAHSDGQPIDADEFLCTADMAMYAAKRQGPGRFLVFDESMRTHIRRHFNTRTTASER